MTEYARPLWLGGGVSYEALEVVDETLRGKAHAIAPGPLRTELLNIANAARAEITKRPKPSCDLI